MYRLIRFYNQNRRRIWMAILIIVSIIIGVRLLNYVYKITSEKKVKIQENTVGSIDYEDSGYSIMTQTELSQTNKQENNDIIDEFINYCNNKEVEKAYDMLTDECKELLYPDINAFFNNYCNSIFKNKKSYTKELWFSENRMATYKMSIVEDALSTGKVKTNKAVEDYYTIVKVDKQKKINISNYVGRKEQKKTIQHEDLKIELLYTDSYIDYEINTFKITNYSDKIIALDSKETTKGTYLEGTKNTKYYSYSHEMELNIPSDTVQSQENTQEDNAKIKEYNLPTKIITVEPNTSKVITIKFNKLYNPDREIKSIVFSDCILDYGEYIKNKNTYKDRINLEIKL